MALHPVYALGEALDARLALMAGLTLVWGARLTYNFARKGEIGGVALEDSRALPVS
jgi:steroid 5-alpha reductase family enzyme